MSGPELKEWIAEERARERDERAREHEDRVQEFEFRAKEQDREQRLLELRLQLLDRGQEAQPVAGVESIPSTVSRSVPGTMCSPHNLIPPFDETRDDLDAYIQRFEWVASYYEWPREKWALSLSLCLTGETLTVIGRMDPAAAMDYRQLKAVLLRRFRYTADGYRGKFRAAKPEDYETALRYDERLTSYFDHWQAMSSAEKSYEFLRDVVITEQFLNGCSPPLRVFIKERDCSTLSAISQAADCFMVAQGLTNSRPASNKAGRGPT